MNILLDTGTLVNNVTPNGVTIDNTPSERVVYPQPNQTYIAVHAGKMVVLTGYGLSNTTVKVEKVLLSNGFPELSKGGCDAEIVTVESTVLNSVAIPCYELTADTPLKVLDIPGLYRVVPDDPEGLITVTAVEYPLYGSGPKCKE